MWPESCTWFRMPYQGCIESVSMGTARNAWRLRLNKLLRTSDSEDNGGGKKDWKDDGPDRLNHGDYASYDVINKAWISGWYLLSHSDNVQYSGV